MSEFVYKVKNAEGVLNSGVIEAPSEEKAVDELQSRGLVILSLEGAEKNIFAIDLNIYLNRPTQKDLVMFTRQLSTLIDADVPLVEGLHTLSRQIQKISFRKMVDAVTADIEGGATLSQAMAKHKIFNKFYISLVRSGEVTGKLQSTLLYLADYLERSAELNAKIKGALAYPTFVIFAMVVVSIIMMTMVLPQLLNILTESGITDLPLTTRVLMALTNFFNKYVYFLLFGFAGLAWFLVKWVRTPSGRAKFDDLKIGFPRLGTVAKNVYISRIAETLATLIKAGVPILEGLAITADIVGHVRYSAILLEAQESVKGGGTISGVFEKYPQKVPVLVASMMAIGEKTGKTDFMLEHMAKFYKSEADRDVQNMAQLIEPILVFILGFGVFVLVSAILLPIYSLVGAA